MNIPVCQFQSANVGQDCPTYGQEDLRWFIFQLVVKQTFRIKRAILERGFPLTPQPPLPRNSEEA